MTLKSEANMESDTLGRTKSEILIDQRQREVTSARLKVSERWKSLTEEIAGSADSTQKEFGESVQGLQDAVSVPYQVKKHPWGAFCSAMAIGAVTMAILGKPKLGTPSGRGVVNTLMNLGALGFLRTLPDLISSSPAEKNGSGLNRAQETSNGKSYSAESIIQGAGRRHVPPSPLNGAPMNQAGTLQELAEQYFTPAIGSLLSQFIRKVGRSFNAKERRRADGRPVAETTDI